VPTCGPTSVHLRANQQYLSAVLSIRHTDFIWLERHVQMKIKIDEKSFAKIKIDFRENLLRPKSKLIFPREIYLLQT